MTLCSAPTLASLFGVVNISFLYSMDCLDALYQVDIYLIDQLLKKRIHPNHRILDAGCGSGRNLRYFIENQYDCIGIDPNVQAIEHLKQIYPLASDSLIVSSIENYSDSSGFDFIVCNAVLHFANSSTHLNELFASLCKLLKPQGILFVRTASNIGIDLPKNAENGVYLLPDGTSRYLITREQIRSLCDQHKLQLIDPVKTTNVADLRSMTTLVFQAQ